MELPVFVLASAAALVGAGVVLRHRNPLVCALGLVVNLLSVAVLFLLLEAQLVAALQVIIYAGAIMVLIVFVIMLLNLSREGPAGRPRRAGGLQGLLALAGAAALLAAILRGVAALPPGRPPGVGPEFGGAAWLARALFSSYYYPFELISLVLLAAMAGAILLAKREI